jgi:hypothetical protein
MRKRYKIHPSIGIARVGKSPSGYFLAAETPDGEPFELAATGEVPFSGYKDVAHLMRRQGVRFRVFAYDEDEATGRQTFAGEVTPDQAAIRWSVALGNRKAAGPSMVSRSGPQGERIIVPGATGRNAEVTGADRARLAATASLADVSGANRPFARLEGSIMGLPLLLGEVGTDHGGRLVVLGATGDSRSWMTPPPSIGSYLNNDGWFDDVADGPVDAELLFPDGRQEPVHDGAWVIVGPPDFAPRLLPFVSLYDVMLDALVQAGRRPQPARVSFPDDIRPILARAAAIRGVNRLPVWSSLEAVIHDPDLADPSPAARSKRQDAADLLKESEESLSDFRLTKTQKEDLLQRWVDGDFDNNPQPPLNPGEELDRVSLSRCIGGGFFPGIEMGFLATNPSLYAELARFTRGPFQDHNGPGTLRAGSATERMAVPWQADFIECSGVWWPVQRPDTARFRQDGSPTPANFRWDRGVLSGTEGTPASHLNMVRHFAQLGVIDRISVGGQFVLAETGRDPALGP